MPKIGTLAKALFHNADLIEVGSPLPPTPGSQQKQYDGVVAAIFYVSGDEFEPEHIDVLAVPAPIFTAMIDLARGVEPEKVFANMTAKATEMLQKHGKHPSAVRRVFPMGQSPVRYYDATLSMGEVFEHYQDRFIEAATAYDDDEEDGGGDGQSATPAPVNGQAAAPAGA